MPQVTITFTEAQLKALGWDIVNIQEWAENALLGKAEWCINQIVKQESVYQPQALPVAEKEQIVLDADIETAAQRQAKLEAQEH